MSTHPLFVHHETLPSHSLDSLEPRLQLADEEPGSEEAHTLGQDVLGEDVDERREEDEGDSGLVDEEEGNELGHRRLENGLRQALVSVILCFHRHALPSAVVRPQPSCSGWR